MHLTRRQKIVPELMQCAKTQCQMDTHTQMHRLNKKAFQSHANRPLVDSPAQSMLNKFDHIQGGGLRGYQHGAEGRAGGKGGSQITFAPPLAGSISTSSLKTRLFSFCRYPFYMLSSINREIKLITWLRYTAWIPLYPMGFTFEGNIFLLY